MRVCLLEMKGIRHFSEKNVDFAEGLNIVWGPNESGKTTILDSLLACLLKPSQKEISSLKQWNAPYSEIALTYKVDGKTFVITRTLYPAVKDTLKGETLLLEDCEEIQNILEEHLGFADRTLFENSTVVKQNEMQILQEEDSRLVVRDRMRELLSGVPERSTDEALEFLEKSITEAQFFLKRTEERIQSIESELQKHRKFDEELKDAKTRLAVYESDLARDQSLLSGYEILIEYRKAESEYKRLVSIMEEIEDLEGYMGKLPIREKELVQELQEELERISGKQDEILVEKRKTREKLTEQKKKLSAIDDELEGVEAEEEGVFSRLGSLLKSSRVKKKELSTKRVEISQDVARLEDLSERYEEQISEWRRRFRERGERLKRLTEQLGEFENWPVDMMESKRKEYESKVEEILQEMTREELEQKMLAKREEADIFRASLVKEHPDLKNREDIERISIEKEKLAEIITEWEEKIAGMRARAELLSSETEKQKSLLEELAKSKEEIKEKTQQMKADRIARDIITLVYKDLKEKFAPELEKRAEILLSRITQGKYQKIVVDEDDLDVLVKVPEKRNPVNVDVLSQGTRDQLYLSLRIALSELLSGDKHLPLVFDEAFYTFDQDRLREAFEVLKDIAQTTQVVVFTHDESYTQYGHPIPLRRNE